MSSCSTPFPLLSRQEFVALLRRKQGSAMSERYIDSSLNGLSTTTLRSGSRIPRQTFLASYIANQMVSSSCLRSIVSSSVRSNSTIRTMPFVSFLKCIDQLYKQDTPTGISDAVKSFDGSIPVRPFPLHAFSQRTFEKLKPTPSVSTSAAHSGRVQFHGSTA